MEDHLDPTLGKLKSTEKYGVTFSKLKHHFKDAGGNEGFEREVCKQTTYEGICEVIKRHLSVEERIEVLENVFKKCRITNNNIKPFVGNAEMDPVMSSPGPYNFEDIQQDSTEYMKHSVDVTPTQETQQPDHVAVTRDEPSEPYEYNGSRLLLQSGDIEENPGPGHEAKFVHPLLKRHECPICLYAMRNPVQTECGHLFCKECLDPVLKKRRPICPLDKEEITQDGIFPDNACRREILNLEVYCNYVPGGCQWVGHLKDLESHLELCEHREIQCIQCGQYIQAVSLNAHQEVECPMRPEKCAHCHQEVPSQQMEDHIKKVCPDVLHKCPNGCNSKLEFNLPELHQHLASTDDEHYQTCDSSDSDSYHHDDGSSGRRAENLKGAASGTSRTPEQAIQHSSLETVSGSSARQHKKKMASASVGKPSTREMATSPIDRVIAQVLDALKEDDGAKVLAVIKSRGGFDVNTFIKGDKTPLMLAAILDSKKVAKVLLDNNASVNVKDEDDATPLFLAVTNGNYEIMKLLVQAGSNVNHKAKDIPMLLEASAKGFSMIVQYLLENGARPNITDKDGQSPLMAAAGNGQKDVVMVLLTHGADVTLVNKKTSSNALQEAIEGGHTDVVVLLMKATTEARRKSDRLFTCKTSEEVRQLIKDGAKVDQRRGDDATPLMVQARAGNLEVVQELIRSGANVDLQDDLGQTALMKASEGGHFGVVQTLVTSRAILDLKTRQGETALMLTTRRKNVHIVKELLLAGADPSARDKVGQSVYDIAKGQGSDDIIEALKKHSTVSSKSSPLVQILSSYFQEKESTTPKTTPLKSRRPGSAKSGSTLIKKSSGGLKPLVARGVAKEDRDESVMKSELDKTWRRVADLETRVHELTLKTTMELPADQEDLSYLERGRLEEEYRKLKELKKKSETYSIEAKQTAQRLGAENFKLKEQLSQEKHLSEITQHNLKREIDDMKQEVKRGASSSDLAAIKAEVFEEEVTSRAYQLLRKMPKPTWAMAQSTNASFDLRPEAVCDIILHHSVRACLVQLVIGGLPYSGKSTLLQNMLPQEAAKREEVPGLKIYEAVMMNDMVDDQALGNWVPFVKDGVELLSLAAALAQVCAKQTALPSDLIGQSSTSVLEQVVERMFPTSSINKFDEELTQKTSLKEDMKLLQNGLLTETLARELWQDEVCDRNTERSSQHQRCELLLKVLQDLEASVCIPATMCSELTGIKSRCFFLPSLRQEVCVTPPTDHTHSFVEATGVCTIQHQLQNQFISRFQSHSIHVVPGDQYNVLKMIWYAETTQERKEDGKMSTTSAKKSRTKQAEVIFYFMEDKLQVTLSVDPAVKHPRDVSDRLCSLIKTTCIELFHNATKEVPRFEYSLTVTCPSCDHDDDGGTHFAVFNPLLYAPVQSDVRSKKEYSLCCDVCEEGVVKMTEDDPRSIWLRSAYKNLQGEITALKEAHDKQQSYIASLETELKQVKEEVQVIARKPTVDKNQLSKVSELEKLVSERDQYITRQKRDLDEVKKQLSSLKTKSDSNAALLQELQLKSRVTPPTRRPTTAAADVQYSNVISETRFIQLEHRVEDLARETSTTRAHLQELEIQLQAQVAATYNGSCLWRIPDVAKRRRDALEDRILSIYSPAFYTGRHGYKMCCRMYLNGDGMGLGMNISVFFVVMRGDYDALLKWPFEHKVFLILVDQTHRKHIAQTFKPTPDSSSFKRPTSDINVASGCPQFASIDVLQDDRYVQDVTMCIKVKCIVDTSKIFHP